MKECPYCNPPEDKQRELVVDDANFEICVIGHTPIGNRRKHGSLQINCKKTGEIVYVEVQRCPVCGQLLYTE